MRCTIFASGPSGFARVQMVSSNRNYVIRIGLVMKCSNVYRNIASNAPPIVKCFPLHFSWFTLRPYTNSYRHPRDKPPIFRFTWTRVSPGRVCTCAIIRVSPRGFSRNEPIMHIYTYTYIQNGLDGSATAKIFHSQARIRSRGFSRIASDSRR